MPQLPAPASAEEFEELGNEFMEDFHWTQAAFWERAFIAFVHRGCHPKDAALKADASTIEFVKRYRRVR